jgi:hypothetical protein
VMRFMQKQHVQQPPTSNAEFVLPSSIPCYTPDLTLPTAGTLRWRRSCTTSRCRRTRTGTWPRPLSF